MPRLGPVTGMLRGGEHRVTNIELFFDLVYVFAVTQLSHHLLTHHTLEGALQTALLLGMVWLAWVYTTWVTNWLDPDRIPTRLLLVGLMLASLVLSAGVPGAFHEHGLVVGGAYAVMQIGRSAFTVWAMRGERLQRNFERVLAWCVLSGACAIAGGLVHGHAREGWWLLAIGVDLLGGAVGFWTPRLGRSTTDEWTIDGGHFAERCQAFVLIALGESIVVTGGTFSDLPDAHGAEITAFVTAFVGAAALWWLYFDRSAEDGAQVVAGSDDPGRLATLAYHFVHPIMIAGIIVTAAADEEVLLHPRGVAEPHVRWMVLGGTALFLIGHAAFKNIVWHVVPWTRLGAVVALASLALIAPHVASLTLAICTGGVIIAVALADRLTPHALMIDATRPADQGA